MPIDFEPAGGGKIDFQPIDFQPIEQDSWSAANSDLGVKYNDAPKDEGVLDRFKRLEKGFREKKKSQLTKDGLLKGIGRMLLDQPVDPFSAVGRAWKEASSLVSDNPSSGGLPEAGAASLVKGYLGVPQGIGQRTLNAVAPNSRAAGISNQFSADADQWYRDQGFTESAYGEGMGASAAGLRIPQGGGMFQNALTGAGFSVARPFVGDGWEAPASDEVNRDTRMSAGIGALVGGGLPKAVDLVGRGARTLSPYVKDMKDFLQRKLAGLNGEKPYEAAVGDLGAMQRRSTDKGNSFYDVVTGGKGGERETDPSRMVADIQTTLADLKNRSPRDETLIAQLEGIVKDFTPGKGEPVPRFDVYGVPRGTTQGAPTASPITPSIKTVNDLTRNLGNSIQSARDTAGQTRQITRTAEEKGILDRVRELGRKAIDDKDPGAAAKLAGADEFWASGGDGYPAPSLYTDRKRLGPTVSGLRGNLNTDVRFDNLTKTKSDPFAEAFRSALSKKGEDAVGARILERGAEARNKAGIGEGPGAWLKEVWDVGKDDLTPMGKQVFKGADEEAVRGAAKIAKWANNVGDLSDFTHLVKFKKLTAPLVENLLNNKATRGILSTLSKVQEGSPEFARGVAALQASMKEWEE